MLGVSFSSFWLILVVAIFALLLVSKLYIKLTTGWCRSQTCLKGKTAIVTGSNTGIGYETALDFAKRGAKVILACRDKKRADKACENIKRETDSNEIFVKLIDFSSLDSVRKFAKDILETEDRLDILVNNAGVGQGNKRIGELQNTMLVNYYAPFLLTHLLIGLLKKSGASRIINVSSLAAKYSKLNSDDLNEFSGFMLIYCNSKLCNILFTIELASKLNGSEVTTYSLHPGVIQTELFRHFSSVFLMITKWVVGNFYKNATEGAQTSIYCAVEKGIEKYNGEHFQDCHYVERYNTAKDPSLAKKVWEKTEAIVKLTEKEKLQ